MNSNEQQHIYHTDIPVGEILRRSRLDIGQSLADVADVIRIKSAQLDAIEHGEFHKLPGKVYALGFVRTYSEYLGLDGDKMVDLFRVQFRVGSERPELHFPTPASESLNPGVFVVIVSIILLIALGLWWGYSSNYSNDNEYSIPDVSDKYSKALKDEEFTPPQPKSATKKIESEADLNADSQINDDLPTDDEADFVNSSSPQTTEEEIKSETTKHSILLKVRDESWVEITDQDGKIIISRNLEKGKEYYVPKHYEGLMLTTGNAGGIVLNIDGKDYPVLGNKGEIKRNIPLNSEILKNMLEKNQEM